MAGRRLLLLLLCLTASLAAGQERPRLGGGFGRPTPTPEPTPAPAATPTPTPRPSATPTPAPARPAPPPAPTAAPAPRRPTLPAPGPAVPRVTLPTPSPEEGEAPRATASVSVGYVLVPFVITDLKGRTRGDLIAEDVTLLVDGEEAPFDLFERSEGAPVSYTILLDGSGSMGLMGKMDGALAAIDALLSARRKGDDFSLHVFAEGTVREIVPFTSEPGPIRRAVRELVPFGKTALFDALSRMPDQSLLGRNGVRAILLLTDGIDNASGLTLARLEEIYSGVDVPVYPIGIRAEGAPVEPEPGVSAEKLMNLRVLGDLARMSGGRLAIVDDPAKLPEAIAEIERDLRSQYVIGFTPAGKGEVKFRRISLRIEGPAYRLRVRAGYRGTEPPARADR